MIADAFQNMQIDPMTGVAAPSDEAQRRFGKVIEGVVQGLKNWVTFPKRAMDEGVTTDQAASWAAPTALGMVASAGTTASLHALARLTIGAGVHAGQRPGKRAFRGCR